MIKNDILRKKVKKYSFSAIKTKYLKTSQLKRKKIKHLIGTLSTRIFYRSISTN